jgi:hypothetical protein
MLPRRPTLLWLLLLPPPLSRGAVFEGEANSDQGFVYLGKFSFDTYETSGYLNSYDASQFCGRGSDSLVHGGEGQVHVVLDAHGAQPAGLQLYLYDDQPDSWGQVWMGHRPVPRCAERSEVWSAAAPPRSGHLPCDGLVDVGRLIRRTNPATHVTTSRWTFTRTIYQKLRPRTWFVALGREDCKPIKGVSYSLTFKNRGGAWRRQMGVNEQGLNLLYSACFMVYVCLVGAQWFVLRTCYRYDHHLPKLLALVLGAEALSALLFSVHFLTFTHDGVGHPLLRFCAECWQATSKLLMALLLLLIAQGWSIIRADVQHRAALFGGLGLLWVATLLVLVWGEFPASSQEEEDHGVMARLGRDAASTKYIYEERPGTLLLLQQLCIGVGFLVSCQRTIWHCDTSQQQQQRSFLRRVGQVFSVYLIFVPLFVFIFSNSLDPWAEEKWVRTVEVLVNVSANVAMMSILWPTRVDNHFLQAGSFKADTVSGVVRLRQHSAAPSTSLHRGSKRAAPVMRAMPM